MENSVQQILSEIVSQYALGFLLAIVVTLAMILEPRRIVLGTISRRVDGAVDAASELVGDVVVEAGAVIENSSVRGLYEGEYQLVAPAIPG